MKPSAFIALLMITLASPLNAEDVSPTGSGALPDTSVPKPAAPAEMQVLPEVLPSQKDKPEEKTQPSAQMESETPPLLPQKQSPSATEDSAPKKEQAATSNSATATVEPNKPVGDIATPVTTATPTVYGPPAPPEAKGTTAPTSAAPQKNEPRKLKVAEYDLKLPDGRKIKIIGIEVFFVDNDGKQTPVPDATYITTDGKVIATRNGKIRGL